MLPDPTFLGTGWAFPPAFTNDGAAVAMVSGAEDIAQSLHILLSTRLGERIMQEEFGCNLADYQFAEINASFISQLHDTIATAIVSYEARIDLLDLTVEQQPAQPELLLIQLTYAIRGTNSRFNLVYPFYLNEGHV